MDAERQKTCSARGFEPWPFALAGGLLAMIAGSLTFYAIARANPDALVVGDAYEAGLRYNAEREERRAAEALGVDIELDAQLAPGSARVRVRVLGAGGGPVAARDVAVRRERPAEGGYDDDFPLDAAGAAFVGDVPLPLPGRWRLVVTARVGGHTVRRSFGVRG